MNANFRTIGLDDTGIGLLGTGQYLQILGSIVIGWYYFHCDTQYDTNQTAVSTIHILTILTSVVQPLSADDGKESGEGVECKLSSFVDTP